jgi:hypothetical protein
VVHAGYGGLFHSGVDVTAVGFGRLDLTGITLAFAGD